MHQLTHDPRLVDRMVSEWSAQADANRLATLARGRRTRRPSLLERLGGRLAAMSTQVRHHTVTHPTTPGTRP